MDSPGMSLSDLATDRGLLILALARLAKQVGYDVATRAHPVIPHAAILQVSLPEGVIAFSVPRSLVRGAYREGETLVPERLSLRARQDMLRRFALFADRVAEGAA